MQIFLKPAYVSQVSPLDYILFTIRKSIYISSHYTRECTEDIHWWPQSPPRANPQAERDLGNTIQLKSWIAWDHRLHPLYHPQIHIHFWYTGMYPGYPWWPEGRKWIAFNVQIDWLGFCVGSRNLLVFVFGPKITWFLCEHRNWNHFCVVGRNWLDFNVQDRTCLDFSVGIRTDLAFVRGSTMTWF